MAVNESLNALTSVAASNTPAGTDSVGTDLDDHLRDIKKNIRLAAEHSSSILNPSGFKGQLHSDFSRSASGVVTLRLHDQTAFINVAEIDYSANAVAIPISDSVTNAKSAQPAVFFASDNDNGLLREAANQWALVAQAKTVQRMHAAGEVTWPLQSAFRATNSAADLNLTSASSGATIVCDTETYDRNADYDNTTGIFTAPVTGLYGFGGVVNLSGIGTGMTSGQIELIAAGASIRIAVFNPTESDNSSSTISIPFYHEINLAASDTCFVEVTVLDGNGVVDLQTETVFFGRLLA